MRSAEACLVTTAFHAAPGVGCVHKIVCKHIHHAPCSFVELERTVCAVRHFRGRKTEVTHRPLT